MEVTDEGVAISELVAAVKNVIKLANLSAANPGRDLQVVSVELSLNAIATRAAGGGIDFRLPVLGMKLKIGTSVTVQDTHAIQMTLVPATRLQHEVRDAEIEIVLLEAIESIRAVMSLASEGDDPFALASSSVDLSFAVAKNGSITLGANGELNGEITHRLRVIIGTP